MNSVFPQTRRGNLALVFDVWQDGDAFAALVAGAEPTSGLMPYLRNHLKVVPLGQGDADDTIEVMVIGWSRVQVHGLDYWVPLVLCTLACELGTVTMDVGGDTWRFCKTVTVTGGLADSAVIIEPDSDGVAAAVFDAMDFERIQFQAHKDSSATSANVLASSF